MKKENKTVCIPTKEELMEVIYISRWNKEKTALTAVLTEKETLKIVNNILKLLKRK